jgi:hypothetical protein
VEPGKFKIINDLVAQETKGRGRVELLSRSTVVGDEKL